MANSRVGARHLARAKAMQALYQWSISQDSIANIEAQFLGEALELVFDVVYFKKLFNEITKCAEQLDSAFESYLNRALSEVDPIELAILRLGAYELIHCLDVPYRVAINESLELAKQYGALQSHKFINGVLDKIAHETRKLEIDARSQGR